MNPRLLATRILTGILSGKGSLNSLLPAAIQAVDEQNRGLCRELCYGTARYFPRLQTYLDVLLQKPLKKADVDILALLCIGLYQLEFTRVPIHAAINETVKIAVKLKKPWAKGLINGVLRRFDRERAAIQSELAHNISFQTAHPEWLVDRWGKAWPDLLDPIIEANNARAPMTLRVNVRGGSRDDYLEALRADSIDAEPTPFAENGVQLTAPIDVEKLPGFNEGRVSVQDEAPQLAAQLLGPQPGDRVLDACCAPGGKTGHLFEIMGEGSTLHALEIDGERIRRVEDNISRIMGTKGDFPSLELFQADGLDLETWWDGNTYQRILLDAPCSATGVIRRNPDIKILRRSSDISNLATLQLDLLRALWKTLAEGGTLLYATCSTLPEENDGVIAEFLNTEESAACEPMDANWGQATRFGRQLFPQINGHDGFYYARLRKS